MQCNKLLLRGRRVPDLVARPAFQGLSENKIGRARISITARNTNVPFKGRIQKRKTHRLQIVKSDLQRTAGRHPPFALRPGRCSLTAELPAGHAEVPILIGSASAGGLTL
jgi:hypothetical protein